jgi:cysteine desulfurase
MCEAMRICGNPSSVHAEGRRARATVERARETVAAAVGAPAAAVTFTSGGTEANNLAIVGPGVERLLVSSIEHASVLEPARRSGKELTLLEVDARGVVDTEALDAELSSGRGSALVSVMLANNETGAIQPARKIAEIAHRHGALAHADAVQAVGKIKVDFADLGVDLMSLSAHKVGGPTGVGALVARNDLNLDPLAVGGGQEFRRRAGTENVVGIAGFAGAIEAATREREPFATRMAALRDRLERAVDAMRPGTHFFAKGAERLPNTTCVAFPGFGADLLLMTLDLEGVAVSSGSACSSGKVSPSHVLTAMGVDAETSRAALRVSFGWDSKDDDVDIFLGALRKALSRLDRRAAA